MDLWRFGGDAARLALDSGSGADSCDAARLVCRDVSIVSNARENNTREQNLSQSLKQKQMLRVAQLLVPTYPKCANHDNLNGCQCLMFFAPLNNLWSHHGRAFKVLSPRGSKCRTSQSTNGSTWQNSKKNSKRNY